MNLLICSRKNMKLFMFSLICLSSMKSSHSLRDFFRGRQRGGNLGEPDGPELLSSYLEKYENEKWFTQNLDHFNPTDQRTWQQKYFVNDEYVSKSRNVAFLNIGGEGPAGPKWMIKGSWIDYAKDFNAICFQLEHRYYGDSHPTEDLSTPNLQYLTSQQALADLAIFIQAMNKEYNLSPDVKWIAFGGSYSGSLAAWLRMKYPFLVHGAMSASGPLLAKLNFPEYLSVVEDDLRSISDSCLTAVKQGTAQIDLLLREKIGQANVDKLFELCDPIGENIKNPKEVSNFYQSLSDNFAGVAQYNLDNKIPSGRSNITLDVLCNIMTDQSLGPEIQRLAVINKLVMSENETCLDYKYDKMTESMRNTSWDSDVAEGSRQWVYQTCTEFGFYQTSDYKPQIFGDKIPLEFFIEQCMDIYGEEFNATYLNKAIDRTNTLYGALNLEVSNVVFVHGTVDPWHVLGITETRDNRAPAILIKGTAHCANMYPQLEDDLPQLKAARLQIKQLIGSWLDL